MISFNDARGIIFQNVGTTTTERVPLGRAFGRVLAQVIEAPHNVPSFDNASMDGYGIRSVDTACATGAGPVHLEIADEVAAGYVAMRQLQRGTAVRVLTGGMIPSGCDALIEQELVVERGGTIEIATAINAGRNIRQAGEDVRAGKAVIQPGVRLTPAHVGVIASLGLAEIDVYRIPRVAFLASGDELVAVGEQLQPGKIRNSNSFTLRGMIQDTGAEPIDLGVARDRTEEIESLLKQGLRHDVVVTSGGASVGKYDLVLEVARGLGVDIKFWKVNIKPGMPIAYGVFRSPESGNATQAFLLPGNPVSTMVTFLQFVRPALLKLMGVEDFAHSLRLKARLEHSIAKYDGKRHFSRGIATNTNGVFTVRTTGSQSSGVLSSLVAANCLMILPEEVSEFREGFEIDIEFLQSA